MIKVHSPPSDHELLIKIRAGWRLERLFSWTQGKCPLAGDSVLLSQILRCSTKTKTRFSATELKRTISKSEERFDKPTLVWLQTQGGIQ